MKAILVVAAMTLLGMLAVQPAAAARTSEELRSMTITAADLGAGFRTLEENSNPLSYPSFHRSMSRARPTLVVVDVLLSSGLAIPPGLLIDVLAEELSADPPGGLSGLRIGQQFTPAGYPAGARALPFSASAGNTVLRGQVTVWNAGDVNATVVVIVEAPADVAQDAIASQLASYTAPQRDKLTPVVAPQPSSTPPPPAAPVGSTSLTPTPDSVAPAATTSGAMPAPPTTQLPEGEARAIVTRVVDGATLEVEFENGVRAGVRYIGVAAPEGAVQDIPGACYEPEMHNRNRELVEGRTVRLERDVSQTDAAGRLLRYVYLDDGRMVNDILIAEGYARVASVPPDVRYAGRLGESERSAREAGLGLWAACPGANATTATRLADGIATSG